MAEKKQKTHTHQQNILQLMTPKHIGCSKKLNFEMLINKETRTHQLLVTYWEKVKKPNTDADMPISKELYMERHFWALAKGLNNGSSVALRINLFTQDKRQVKKRPVYKIHKAKMTR